MGGIFSRSKPKKPQVTEQDMAILQVKQSRDKLKQFQKKLSSQLESELSIVKQLVEKGRKDKALLLLRKKKYTEKILIRTDNELANIENLIMDIEFKQVETDVLKGMQVGNECLKQLNDVFSIEQIEELLDDTSAAIDKQREIDALLSGPNKEEFDESELSNELNSILGVSDKEVVEEQLPEVPGDELPEVEKAKEKKKTKPEAEEQERVALEA